MKSLVLIRHAKAKKSRKLKDFERPLRKRGLKDAPLVGSALKEHHILPGLILSSPADRALTTAKIIAKEVNVNESSVATEPRLYLESKSKLMEVINDLDDSVNTVFIVGHNPGLTDLANSLSREPVENIPTGGAWAFRFNNNNWSEVHPGEGSMMFSETPRKSKKKSKKSEKPVL